MTSLADPDKNPGPEAAAQFDRIRSAFSRLTGAAEHGRLEISGHDWIGRVSEYIVNED